MNNFAWITTSIFIFFIVLESFLSNLNGRTLYDFRDSVNNLLLGIGGMLMDLLMKGITFGVLNFIAANYAFVHLEHPVAIWLGVFLAQDFCFYWLHRVEHSCRAFWAVHVNHHSSQKFNFSVALRSSTLQPLYRFFFFIPCALLGFDGFQIMFIYAINQTYAFFIHTETVQKLGFLEKILVTPSHHRVHHASNPEYLDRNMGQVLIIWDKLFGTFAQETTPVKYGLTKDLETYDVSEVLFHEWKMIRRDLRKPLSWKVKWKYLMAPPGWSHDGSSLTAKEMRAKLSKIRQK